MLLSWPVLASSLPVRMYSAADGLRNNAINRIVTDSRGFLWLCTSDGVSRFDGYGFLNLSESDGLSHRRVNDVLESRSGDFWIATDGGLCRLVGRPAPAPAVESQHLAVGAGRILRLLEARRSTAAWPVIWCGTDSGLFRFTPRDGGFDRVELGADHEVAVLSLYQDADGVLWVGTLQGLYRYREGGETVHYTVREGLPANQVTAIRRDRLGSIWVATWRGAARLTGGRVDRVLTRASGLAAEYLYDLLPAPNGDLWLAGTGGLTVVDSSGVVRRKLGAAEGLVVDDMEALAQDANGNIWAGTDGGGVAKIAQSGFTTYTHRDGIAGKVSAILESKAGEVVALTKTDDALRLYARRGERFRFVCAISSRDNIRWGDGQIAFQGANRDWWITTGGALYRFPASPGVEGLAGKTPVTVPTGPPGSGGPLKTFEDSRGDVWMAFRRAGRFKLARLRRHTGELEEIAPDGNATGVPSFPYAFAEDRAGGIWVGYFQGPLMRYRDGHLREIEAPARARLGIRSLLVDSKGRLWAGTSEAGLLRFDDPAAEQPRAASYSVREGLSGDLVACLTEDRFGRIYACTGRGVDALDPASGRLCHYTGEDGLVKGDLEMALRDRDGALWFASSLGLSRLVPQADRQTPGPYVQISRLEIAGVSQGISRLGQARLTGLSVPFGVSPVRIEVTGVTLRPGDVLRYQTELEHADRDWSAPTTDRTTSYAALRPGSYRFRARAVNAEGLTSSEPAEVEFTVLAPLWARWWFLSLVAAALAAVAVAAHRMRTARLLEIERVRSRIATDLHDDIGSTLSQISVLSEVARRDSGGAANAPIGRISELAREVLDSMGDIVWAINPARDRCSDLIQRMRHFAAEVFAATDVDLAFGVDSAASHQALHPELRRELLLVFKEAVNNVVKHAGAKRVTVKVWTQRGMFAFEIADDGRGFDRAEISGEGHGLPGIERRTRALGGSARIWSRPGEGTTVRVEVQAGMRRGNWWRRRLPRAAPPRPHEEVGEGAWDMPETGN